MWIGDGTNFPGQQNLGESLDRYLESARAIYAAIPADWRMFIEHKLYEPAFYSTVISDWGTSILVAKELGPKARCLVDLGHHAPNVNIEQIVARLHAFCSAQLAGDWKKVKTAWKRLPESAALGMSIQCAMFSSGP